MGPSMMRKEDMARISLIRKYKPRGSMSETDAWGVSVGTFKIIDSSSEEKIEGDLNDWMIESYRVYAQKALLRLTRTSELEDIVYQVRSKKMELDLAPLLLKKRLQSLIEIRKFGDSKLDAALLDELAVRTLLGLGFRSDPNAKSHDYWVFDKEHADEDAYKRAFAIKKLLAAADELKGYMTPGRYARAQDRQRSEELARSVAQAVRAGSIGPSDNPQDPSWWRWLDSIQNLLVERRQRFNGTFWVDHPEDH